MYLFSGLRSFSEVSGLSSDDSFRFLADALGFPVFLVGNATDIWSNGAKSVSLLGCEFVGSALWSQIVRALDVRGNLALVLRYVFVPSWRPKTGHATLRRKLVGSGLQGQNRCSALQLLQCPSLASTSVSAFLQIFTPIHHRFNNVLKREHFDTIEISSDCSPMLLSFGKLASDICLFLD